MRLLLSAALLSSFAFAADDPAVSQFTQRVNRYAAIRATAARKVPALPKAATPEQIEAYEKALVNEIRTARATAKPGEIFVPEVRPLFYKILKENFSGPENKESREQARVGNPEIDKEPGEAAPVIQVNASYPKSSPVSTVPPALLQQLPRLPKDLEYRFSGHTLILLDSLSNLIVDFLKRAAPEV